MSTFLPIDKMLSSAADYLSERLDPMIGLVEKMVNCIVPKATAQASPSADYYCGIVCLECCAECSGDYRQNYYWLYNASPNCDSKNGFTVYMKCDYC